MPNKKADPLADVAAQIVADDPDIRGRMKVLVNTLLDDAFHLVKFGTPQERMNLMRAVVPALMRGMQGGDANASEAREKQAYERMMAELRGDTPRDKSRDTSRGKPRK